MKEIFKQLRMNIISSIMSIRVRTIRICIYKMIIFQYIISISLDSPGSLKLLRLFIQKLLLVENLKYVGFSSNQNFHYPVLLLPASNPPFRPFV